MSRVDYSGKSILSDKGYIGPFNIYDEFEIKKILDWLSHDYKFEKVIKNPHLQAKCPLDIIINKKLTSTVEQVLGEKVFIENLFFLNKFPNDGFKVPLHQDGINPKLVLNPGLSLSIWVSLSFANKKNGGLKVYPGSHVNGYLEYKSHQSIGKTTFSVEPPNFKGDFEYMETRAGECLMMDVRLVHGSDQNLSTTLRSSMNLRLVKKHGIVKRFLDHKLVSI